GRGRRFVGLLLLLLTGSPRSAPGGGAARCAPRGTISGVDDHDLFTRIDELVEEEHRLRSAGHPLTEQDRARLGELEVHLDTLWDLMRQRRARREFGEDPDAAEERPAPEVESYLQ
ncbi:MAG TPA: DUF2630 family protein, partial [Acidimicrobiales bacterium]|nr:DUF2630 family protein [Acidimicrobiales bacterium]